MQTVTTTTAECVQHHPESALEAWSRVVQFDPTAGTSKYIDEWRAMDAYSGLKLGKMEKGSVTLNPDAIHPSSIRDQFTINKFLELVPDEKTAHDQTCVTVYDEHLPKKELELRRTKCGKWLSCQTVNQKGEFEGADNVAKNAYKKEKKGQVVSGYCLNGGKTKKANWENARNFTEQTQLMRDRITELENELAEKDGKTSRKMNSCAPVPKK